MSCKFGWKRKTGEKVSLKKSSAFEKESKDDDDNEVSNGEVDWLSLMPKKKRIMCLEDAQAKSDRLKKEGSTLADAERYWEAIKKWEGALQLTPEDETIHEMISQAYTILHEVYPAVRSARKVIEINPRWWIAHQTLGRAELNLGEVRLAIKSFSRALHINPASEELWVDDLNWARQLLKQKIDLQEELRTAKDNCTATVTELVEDSETAVELHTTRNYPNETLRSEKETLSIKKLPSNYVQMRDVLK
ncbi:tetratricopeptide repeat protein 33-like [Lineus longissimus]|uniref:tetratricopeptide repeat protein 33-like n=1 Tax=Lineus longissimus TaxID=88925 RepID=UPI002B4C7559